MGATLTLKGVNATIVAAGGESQIANGMFDARCKVMTDRYVTVGTGEDATSLIKMGYTLPSGARIKDVILDVSANLTGSVTISVGDSTLATRYITAAAVSTAGIFRMSTAGGSDYVIGTATADGNIYITLNAANNAVSGSIIKLHVIFAMD